MKRTYRYRYVCTQSGRYCFGVNKFAEFWLGIKSRIKGTWSSLFSKFAKLNVGDEIIITVIRNPYDNRKTR